MCISFKQTTKSVTSICTAMQLFNVFIIDAAKVQLMYAKV